MSAAVKWCRLTSRMVPYCIIIVNHSSEMWKRESRQRNRLTTFLQKAVFWAFRSNAIMSAAMKWCEALSYFSRAGGPKMKILRFWRNRYFLWQFCEDVQNYELIWEMQAYRIFVFIWSFIRENSKVNSEIYQQLEEQRKSQKDTWKLTSEKSVSLCINEHFEPLENVN